jgi:hypothetical protein
MACGHDFKFHILGFQKFYPDAIQSSERAGAEVSLWLGFASSKHAVQFFEITENRLKTMEYWKWSAFWRIRGYAVRRKTVPPVG